MAAFRSGKRGGFGRAVECGRRWGRGAGGRAWRWGGFGRAFALGDGGQGGFDVRGGEFGHVQQGERGFGVLAGEDVADGEAVGFQRAAFVLGQEMAVTDQEEMRLGRGAEAGARDGEVGGAAGLGAVRRVRGDFGQRAHDGLEVAVEDLREQIVQVREEAADGVRGHAHGDGEIGEADGGAAVVCHEVLRGIEDGDAPFLLLEGEVWAAVAGDVIALGAEDAGWGVHGREDSERRGNAARGNLRGVVGEVRARDLSSAGVRCHV